MRILLDECLPQQLKAVLQGHEAVTTAEASWSGQENGELLKLARKRFDLILTVDQRFVQRSSIEEIAVIILKARSNSLESLLPLVPKLLSVLSSIKAGEVKIISA